MSRKQEVVSRLVELYRSLASRPSPVSGRLMNESRSAQWSTLQLVTALWTQRNLERGQMTNFLTTYQVSKDDVRTLVSVDTSNELISQYSPSENLRCVVRQVADGTKKKQYLELWEKGRLLRNWDLTAMDLHGDIYADDEFGSIQWSHDEKQVVYVAEKKKPKATPFYKPSIPKENPAKEEDQAHVGEEFVYVEDWGEQLVGKSQSVICLCDIEEGTLRLVEGVPSKYCPGQLVWSANSQGLYGLGVENTPRRLGLVYCTNRAGVIFHLSLSGEFSVLSEVGMSPRSCRLSPDGKTLVWLQRPAGGAHNGCQALIKMDTSTNERTTVIDIVDKETSMGEETFLGIYGGLAPRCFALKSNLIVFDTVRKFEQLIYTVNIDTYKMSKLGQGKVLDVSEDRILVSTSSPSRSPYLEIINLNQSSDRVQITEPYNVLADDVLHTHELKTEQSNGSDGDALNLMLLKPAAAAEKTLPLIVFPHGGPHGALSEVFMLEPAFFVTLRFAVLLINYRGSTGCGQAAVDSLPGHIGDLDVKDCQQSVEYVLKNYPDIDPNKLVAYGGSHGGFLSLQLAGQYPSIYKSVVVRNPVVDLPSMYVTSDIPDWVACEAGYSYSAGIDLSNDMLEKMAVVSPIRHISKVQAPTLLLVGANDLRVPPTQPIHYYKVLKAIGIKTKLHLYNDSHPLSAVPVHLDALINSTLWILETLHHDI